MPEDDALAQQEADNYRRALEGFRHPPGSDVDSEQPPVAAEPELPEAEE